jgi:ATP-dependent helicase/nuclease subunit B
MLDEVAPQYYGTNPSPVVRVQIENMRSRLMAAATTEARIRSEGWETIAAEHQVKKEDGRELGGLLLTGTMDRVDRHPEKGLRILDYKTFSDSRKQNPAYTHIGPHRGRKHLPEADFEILTANGDPRPRSWLDLQLPLYAWLAKKIWPDDAAKGIQVGYFLLPPDAEPGAISLKFLELTGEMQTSAEECAGRIAQLVKGGNFWPPSPSSEVEYDDYKDWFMEGDPQKLIDDESARWLNGNP